MRALALVVLVAVVALLATLALGDRREDARDGDAEPFGRASVAEGRSATPTHAPLSDAREPKVAGVDAPVASDVVVSAETNAGIGTLIVQLVAAETGAPIHSEAVGVRVGVPPEAALLQRYTDVRGELRAEVEAGRPIQVFTTGGDGSLARVELDVEPLAVNEERHVLLRANVSVDETLALVVVAEEDGHPIRDARVTLEENEVVGRFPQPWMPRGELVATSAADGRVDLSFATWQSKRLFVQANGRAPRILVLARGVGNPDAPREVRLALAATIRGRIESERASSGFIVRATASATDLSVLPVTVAGHDVAWECASSATGTFELGELPPDVPLRIQVFGLARGVELDFAEPFVLQPGEVRDVAWSIGGGATVRGVVRDQHGQPVEAFVVRLGRVGELASVRAASDAEGRFAFEDVALGEWELRAGPAHEQRERWPRYHVEPVRVRVDASSRELDFELLAYPGKEILGVVVDPKGEPADWARIEVIDRGGRVVYTEHFGRGSFRIAPLAPGTYRLVARARPDLPGRAYADSDVLTVEAGASDVEVRLREGAVVAGTVVGEFGLGVIGTVSVMTADAPDQDVLLLAPQRTGRDGTFRFVGLPRGAYVFLARTDEGGIGVSREVFVAGNETTLDPIVVEDAGTLVLVSAFDARRVATLVRGARGFVERLPLARATPTRVSVPPGEVTIRAAPIVGADGVYLPSGTRFEDLVNGEVGVERVVMVVAGEEVGVELGE